MALSEGARLGSYEILSPLGAGGMGEVYRARDTRLERTAAIKVLPEQLASDSERLKRFEQEARSASALNHPNVVTIYDIAREGATSYIAMELVEGSTLRELGALPIPKLLNIGTQIAEGLAQAHGAGIVHRDLKPENVMVRSDGLIKILDFGLAKLLPTSEAQSNRITLTKEGTREGVLVGTVSYMSPEQARGRAVDHRSDQFSLGLILYELATGKRAFERETAAQTLTAIMEDEPEPVGSLNPKAPSRLSALIARCLAKDPEERYDSTRDLARELKSVGETPSVTHPRRTLLVASLLGGLLALVLGLGILGDIGGSGAGIESLAVLPLKNLSGDPEQEYFSDGMTEALTADIAKIGALKVISSTSAMRYKDTDKSLPEIGRDLDVDGIVEGSVLRSGERIRIIVQLVDAEADEHVWAETYERNLEDVLSLQSEVARAIAGEIEIILTPQERTLLAVARPVNSAAHDAYLRGRYFFNQSTEEGFDRALDSFERAIEEDASYAPAYAGLADTYVVLGSGYMLPREAGPRAKVAAMKALELDETLAEAHSTLGQIRFFFDWDWRAAQSESEQAIQLNPSYARAHFVYSMFLAVAGRMEEAMAEAERARELDPLNLVFNANLAAHFYLARRHDETIELCQRTLEIEPNFFLCHMHLFSAFSAEGRYEESFETYKKVAFLFGQPEVAEAADRGYAESGYQGAVLAGARQMAAQAKLGYIAPYFVAALYALTEEREETFLWLERAYEERAPLLTLLRREPRWDSIRDDPRFEDLAQRIGLPE